ncbi:unnamed protein product [Effrenium voratum]|nr:unnamed protein product [Effrenium voratum]
MSDISEGALLGSEMSLERRLPYLKWVLLALLGLGGVLGHQSRRLRIDTQQVVQEYAIPPGAGVNLGGWLVLEDWFFSGSSGSLVTSSGVGQGRCLPPLVHDLEEPWPSEGVLAFRLNASKGQAETVRVFEAHRSHFLAEDDLRKIAESGITTVRLPLTWAAFADALAPLSPIYSSYDPEHESALVPDPFYLDKAALVTIRRDLVADFLRQAAEMGLQVVLDLHALPGGSQDGTYNGVWPNRPVFWSEQTQLGERTALSLVGRWVAQKMIAWVEGLDPLAKQGVAGLTLMNEPAHMNAWKDFAKEQDVLSWLADTADDFRRSSLPGQVKLYVNLIETAFSQFEHSAVPWFLTTFTHEERLTWAVADVHWYVAWSNGDCDGRTVQGGGFSCSAPLPEVQAKLHDCASSAASRLRKLFEDAQVAVTEFSAGTFHEARYACHDTQLLRAFLEEELKAFQSDQIQPFFWTWKMPFGPNFEAGWSLKYLLGLEDAELRKECDLKDLKVQF